MIGWRAKLGVLVPSGNTTMEPELYGLAPKGVSLHFARLKLKVDTRGEIEKMLDNLEGEATLLSDGRVDAICFGCTAGSFYGGVDYDREIIRRIEAVTGTSATTTSTAVVQALKALRAVKISVATPYEDWLNARLRLYLQQHNFDIVSMKGLGMETGVEAVPPEKIYRMVKEITDPAADAVFISCSNFPAVTIVEKLERDLRKAVVTSNLATMWNLLRLLGLSDELGDLRLSRTEMLR